jgi:hypothetical protein
MYTIYIDGHIRQWCDLLFGSSSSYNNCSKFSNSTLFDTYYIGDYKISLLNYDNAIRYNFCLCFQTIASTFVLRLVDEIYFTYHLLSFLLYMITFTEFRREFIAIIKCAHDRVVLINIVPRNTLTVEGMIGIRTSAAIIRNLNIKRKS